ncbi:MAG: hypothetical protein AAF517_24240 [Planctomycetota bacterium]
MTNVQTGETAELEFPAGEASWAGGSGGGEYVVAGNCTVFLFSKYAYAASSCFRLEKEPERFSRSE